MQSQVQVDWEGLREEGESASGGLGAGDESLCRQRIAGRPQLRADAVQIDPEKGRDASARIGTGLDQTINPGVGRGGDLDDQRDEIRVDDEGSPARRVAAVC